VALPSQPPRRTGLPPQPYAPQPTAVPQQPVYEDATSPSYAPGPGYGAPVEGGYAPAVETFEPVVDDGGYDAVGFTEDDSYADGAFEQFDTAQEEVAEDSPFQSRSDLSVEDQRAAQLLLEAIADDESSEVIINGPTEVLEKIKGQRFHNPEITFSDADTLHKVLNEYVLRHVDTPDRIDGVNVLVEGQLELPSTEPGVPPMLARVHILAPPLVQYAKVTIAKKARYEFDLDGIARTGALTSGMAEFLKAAGHGRLTMVVSGPTGAGKTTLLQAVSRHYDQNDRIIVIEDTPELRLPLADVVYLCSSQPKPGRSADDVVTTEWLVKATQRMRMDRVIVGECRGAEMAEWLIAANSGAEGSATTVHADNPRRALDKILSLATKSPTAGSEATLRREIAATVDIVVQAGLVDGRHVITHIEEVSKTVRENAGTGLIATQTLFEYNRATSRHEVRSRPSDDLVNTLKGRGVPVNVNWFRG
jgi:pilus assembly protein CpaF